MFYPVKEDPSHENVRYERSFALNPAAALLFPLPTGLRMTIRFPYADLAAPADASAGGTYNEDRHERVHRNRTQG